MRPIQYEESKFALSLTPFSPQARTIRWVYKSDVVVSFYAGIASALLFYGRPISGS